ncbi:hypothetical protein Pmani_022904 [Petrolisthes manimaculis]|uniref:NADH dehydrogenase (ubiquinone) complex I, assembly factor 6 n=1 Tax=Petrolisthes manimaculis TaxID=1843537 RepID=A0AAE1PB24_9EUCA|nr:hypothetical protein Pmani_022904 [Petrolisthes manimaculis]
MALAVRLCETLKQVDFMSVSGASHLTRIYRTEGRRSLATEGKRNHTTEGKRSHTTDNIRSPVNSSQYCLDLVRRSDYENFMATLLLPQQARATAIAIRAFNVEVAQIQDLTSEILMAKMRLQFWRETLDDIYKDKAPKQPVAMALQKAVQAQKLSKRWLRSLIDSREDHLGKKQFPTLEAVEDYGEKSNSVLYYLVLQGLGVENVHADHAASHLGKAEGLVRLVRGVPHHATRKNVFLPRDVMIKHGVSQENIIRGSQDQKVKDVIFDTASLAHQHLEHARSFIQDVPKEARVALLPAAALSDYLTALQSIHFDVFHSSLQLRNNKLPFRMLWNKLCKKY